MRIRWRRLGSDRNRGRTAGWIDAGKRDHDVRIFRSEIHHFVVRDLRSSSESFVHGKNDAANLSRPVIVRDLLRREARVGISEVFARCFLGRIPGFLSVNMNMSIDSCEFVEVERCVWHLQSTILFATYRVKSCATVDAA